MKFSALMKFAGAVALGGLSATSANASVEIIFGQDFDTGSQVPALSNAAAKRQLFMSKIKDAQFEDFELAATGLLGPESSYGDLMDPPRMNIFGTTGLLKAQPTDFFTLADYEPNNAKIRSGASIGGRYNTTNNTAPGNPTCVGCKWFDTPLSFTIVLNQRFSAFGFYATDAGDIATINNNFDRTVLSFYDGVTPILGQQAVSLQGGPDRNLAFFGYLADGFVFDRIEFTVTQTGPGGEADSAAWDFLGLDDLIVGNLLPNSVPVPSTLALIGLSLALLAGTRRRRASV